MTLPVILLMEKISKDRKRQVADIFLKDSPEGDDFNLVLDLMKDHGILERSLDVAMDFRDRAIHALEQIPECSCRTSLHDLADYVVERNT